MKEKFEDIRALLSEINDGISLEHDGQCHELMNSILNVLGELEFFMDEEL